MYKVVNRNQRRKKRHWRQRNKIFGIAQKPRLNVFRSSKHIYAQLIDDEKGHTLVAASSLDQKIKDGEGKTKTEVAREVGKLLADYALRQGITEVVFDRGGYLYHGRVKALAEGAREGGLEF